MPNIPMTRSSPSMRNDSIPGKNASMPPKSPTVAHTSSAEAPTLTFTDPSAMAFLLVALRSLRNRTSTRVTTRASR